MLPLRDTIISKKTPSARIITIIPILIFPWFLRIPAIIFFGSVVFSSTVVWAHLHDNVERGSNGWCCLVGAHRKFHRWLLYGITYFDDE